MKPTTLFITCCDNRIIPYSFTSKEPGDLFILRNIGNLIPPYQAQENSVAVAIEYAIGHLGIPEVVVCGHSDCGAMKSILKHPWLEHAIPSDGFDSLDKRSQANVLHQIKNLKTYPAIIKKAPTIYGWWFDIENRVLYCYDEKSNDWIKS